MKVKSILAMGATVTTAALLLAGCTPTASAPDLTASGSTTITLWVDTERAPALKDIAAQFKKDTGITVKLEVKDFATVDQDFISQVPTGKGPDIIVSPHDKLGAYVANGVVAPLELGDVTNEFAASAIRAMSYDGVVYGVPYSIENVALLRNADLVPDASATMDDVLAKGKAFAGNAKDKYPFLVGLSPEQGDPYHLYPLQTSFGSEVFGLTADGAYDPSNLTLGDAAGLKFAAALKTWGEEGVLNANIDGDKAKEFFLAGKSPYYIGVNGFFLSSKSTNALAATQFIVNYLSTEDVQLALYKVGGRPPALTAAYDKAAATDPDVQAFGAIGQNGVPMPAIPAMGSVWADWGNAEMTIIKGADDPAAVWTTAADNITTKIAG
jgi:arabinogalactan oligomer / maltooligosaccharide transport system substrate-binding protein